MGYLSRYNITVVPDHLQNEVEAAIVRRVGYDPFKDECTWYDFIKDVCAISSGRLEAGYMVKIDRRGEAGERERVFVSGDGMYQSHQEKIWTPPDWPSNDLVWRTP